MRKIFDCFHTFLAIYCMYAFEPLSKKFSPLESIKEHVFSEITVVTKGKVKFLLSRCNLKE
jgi:hypothetical protein